MTIQDQNDWYRILSLARSHAAQDLNLSNQLLEISDILATRKKGELTEETVSEINERLVEIALELSDKSKDMNFAITKLVGVI